MPPPLFLRGLCLLLAAATSPAFATIVNLTADLEGANEIPAKVTYGTGTASLTLDDTANTLAVNLSFSGLSGYDTAIAIHCCAGASSNAGIALQFTAAQGAPLGVYSGTFTYLYDLTTISLGGGLTPATFAAQLEAGNAYLNIHTYTFVAGEVRGQIVQDSGLQISGPPTPEPPPITLMAVSALVLVFLKREHKRR